MEPITATFQRLQLDSGSGDEEVAFLLEHKVKILENLRDGREYKIAAKAFKALHRTGPKGQYLDTINFAIISGQINFESVGLDCSKCMITRFPKSLFTAAKLAAFWERLESLDLSHNQLSWLPEEFGMLPKLTKIDLSYNRFTTFPEELTRIAILRALNLRANSLTEIPPAIGKLKCLTLLYLDTNKIEYLPPEIEELPQVSELDLSRNQLKFLPNEICSMPKLTRLWLRTNPLVALPAPLRVRHTLKTLFVGVSDETLLQPQAPAPSAITVILASPSPRDNIPPTLTPENPALPRKGSGCTLL